jgi:hypothetical protein
MPDQAVGLSRPDTLLIIGELTVYFTRIGRFVNLPKNIEESFV